MLCREKNYGQSIVAEYREKDIVFGRCLSAVIEMEKEDYAMGTLLDRYYYLGDPNPVGFHTLKFVFISLYNPDNYIRNPDKMKKYAKKAYHLVNQRVGHMYDNEIDMQMVQLVLFDKVDSGVKIKDLALAMAMDICTNTGNPQHAIELLLKYYPNQSDWQIDSDLSNQYFHAMFKINPSNMAQLYNDIYVFQNKVTAVTGNKLPDLKFHKRWHAVAAIYYLLERQTQLPSVTLTLNTHKGTHSRTPGGILTDQLASDCSKGILSATQFICDNADISGKDAGKLTLTFKKKSLSMPLQFDNSYRSKVQMEGQQRQIRQPNTDDVNLRLGGRQRRP